MLHDLTHLIRAVNDIITAGNTELVEKRKELLLFILERVRPEIEKKSKTTQ